METTFQTQTQSTCTSISQEEGFLTGRAQISPGGGSDHIGADAPFHKPDQPSAVHGFIR